MIVMIDNYDSFTYNIVQSISSLTDETIEVLRSKECSISDIEKLNPDKLIISPGPGSPKDAGISCEAIRHFAKKIPILGICLGHQAIGFAFGADIVRAKNIKHGIVEDIELDGKAIFRFIGKSSKFTRYHSLVIDKDTLPNEFEITAMSKDGDIMGIRHKEYLIEGLQFHPESIASENCNQLFAAFLNYRRESISCSKILGDLINKNDLTKEAAKSFMEDLTDGFANNCLSAAILSALAVKGETATEIAGCAEVLHKKRKSLPISKNFDLVDIVGTGGDEKGSFNISSMAALVAAASGIMVAKHGNRAVSSKSGSADFYETLGIKIDTSPEETAKIIEKTNFGFLYAPIYHGAMRHAAPIRKSLGVKTIMNLLGPLSNPADAKYQMIGVYSTSLLDVVAEASKMLGSTAVMVVCSEDGFDEISPCAKTHVVEIGSDNIKHSYSIEPSDFGITECSINSLAGGSAHLNVDIANALLSNTNAHVYKSVREAVCLNAGAALYIGKKAASMKEGYEMAHSVLANGEVLKKIQEIKDVSNGRE